MIDRLLTGLRNQGPGAIPALILSLLALGAVAYWLLSRDDDQPTQTAEVVSAPATLTPTTTPSGGTSPTPADQGSGSGSNSGGGGAYQGSGGGAQNGGPATAPAVPASPDSGGGSDAAAPTDQGGSSNGGQGSGGDKPPSLDDIQQLLQGGNGKPDRHQGSSTLPGLDNLLGNGAESDDQAPSGPSIEDLLDQLRSQNQD